MPASRSASAPYPKPKLRLTLRKHMTWKSDMPTTLIMNAQSASRHAKPKGATKAKRIGGIPISDTE